MSWLACMNIDAETVLSGGVRDSYDWHQRLWHCFPGEPRAEAGFSDPHRHAGGSVSAVALVSEQTHLPRLVPAGEFCHQGNCPLLSLSPALRLRLARNPVKCLVQRTELGKRKRHGKRVPLIQPDELRAWIDRKGQAGGFQIVADKPLEIGPVVKSHFRKKEQAACHGGVQFRGVLEVTDPEKFTETYYAGVGSAKGFGFGLLLLAPVRL